MFCCCCYFYLILQLHLIFEKWRSRGRCNNCHESAATDSCHLTNGCLCMYIYNSDREEENDTRIFSLDPANLPLCRTKLLLHPKAWSSLAVSPRTQVGIYIQSRPKFCCFSAAGPHLQPHRKCSVGQKE